MANDKTVALFGYGYWGKKVWRVLNDLGYQVLIVEKNPLKTKKLTISEEAVFSSKKITQVFIATPEETHFELVEKSLKAGKDVFVEKPLCLKKSQASQLVKMASSSSLVLHVDYIFLFDQVLPTIKRILAKKQFGQLQHLESVRRSQPASAKKVGVIADLAIHDISIFRYLNLIKLESKKSSNICQVFNNHQSSLAFVQWQFHKNITANSAYSWLHPEKERVMTFLGTKQTLRWEVENLSEKLTLFQNGDHQTQQKPKIIFQKNIKNNPSPLEKSIQHFFSLCRSSRKPLILKKQYSQYVSDTQLLEKLTAHES